MVLCGNKSDLEKYNYFDNNKENLKKMILIIYNKNIK